MLSIRGQGMRWVTRFYKHGFEAAQRVLNVKEALRATKVLDRTRISLRRNE